MDGRVAIEEIYARRLALIGPDREAIARLARRYLASLVEGADQVVGVLQAAGKQVHIVSGGFLPAVERVAGALSIPRENVHAVNLRFRMDGEYAGFDESSPLARSGGKAVIAAELIRRYGAAAAVGDGITDLDMKAAGAVLVGFGGVVARERVRRDADYYVNDPSMLAVLPLLLTPEEQERYLRTIA
jgi:phosphoserine phosphatase